MSARCALAVTAALLLAAPALAADGPPKPTLVVQLQPAGRLVADVKELVRLAAGPKDGDAAVRAFLTSLEETLGKEGFQGLDLNRPIAGYVTVREKFEDSTPVLVAPYTSEQAFLGLLDRLKFKTEAVPGKKGAYKLTLPEVDFPGFDHDSYLRFADGWAYLGFNGEEVLDPAKLVPVTDLLDPREQAQVAIRLYPDRFPEKLLKNWLTDFETTVNEIKGFLLPDDPHLAKGLGTTVEQTLKLIRRYPMTLQADGREAVLRVTADTLTGELVFELTVTPKPGSALAKDVAALKPAPNRFAGMVAAIPDAGGKPAAALGLTGRVPASIPEFREITVALSEMFAAVGNEQLPEPLRPVSKEVFAGLERTAKKGDVDFAAAMLGPDKDDRFTLLVAVAIDDPAAVEKALRDGMQNPLVRKVLKLDADKAGTLPVHTLAVGGFLDGDVLRMVGKDAVIALAVGKDALYVAFGPPSGAVAALKAAVTFTPKPDAPVRPTPGAYMDWVGNMGRFAKLVAATDGPDAGKRFAEVMGTEDRLVPLTLIAAEGGEKLTIRFRDNVKYLFGSLFASPPPDGEISKIGPGK